MSELSKVEQLCEFIAKQGVARTAAIVQQFPDTNGNVFNILEGPVGSGFLIACKVAVPAAAEGRMREMWEYRLSEAAIGKTYAQWKAEKSTRKAGTLKAPVLSDRAAAALAAAEPPVERPRVAGNPISARRQVEPQPAVGKNTGSARLVTSSGTPFAEARTVAPTPAAQPAPSPARSGRDVSSSGPSWMISSDGTLAITHGDTGLLLSAEHARRLARLLASAAPLLDEIHAQAHA